MIDDVERGANDSDWQPTKDAARKLAFAEDRAISMAMPPPGSSAFARALAIPKNLSPPMSASIQKPLRRP